MIVCKKDYDWLWIMCPLSCLLSLYWCQNHIVQDNRQLNTALKGWRFVLQYSSSWFNSELIPQPIISLSLTLAFIKPRSQIIYWGRQTSYIASFPHSFLRTSGIREQHGNYKTVGRRWDPGYGLNKVWWKRFLRVCSSTAKYNRGKSISKMQEQHYVHK